MLRNLFFCVLWRNAIKLPEYKSRENNRGKATYVHMEILITCNSIYGEAPKYLWDLVFNQILLEVPVTRRKCYGDRAFSVVGLSLSNEFPGRVKSATSLGIFSSLLKTHLFKIVF